MLPVDEYIPIMFDQHFNETWKKAFADEEKLTAWSAAPLILFPTRYTGENGYISDTEESDLVQLEGKYIKMNSVPILCSNSIYYSKNLQNRKQKGEERQ